MMRSMLAVLAVAFLAVAACEPQGGDMQEEQPGATEQAPMPADSPMMQQDTGMMAPPQDTMGM